MRINYEPQKCHHCGQTMTYLLPIDQGTVDIVKSIASAIRKKGVNLIHPRKEMEVTSESVGAFSTMHDRIKNGQLTSNQVGNLSRARFHGLIARVSSEKGCYLLTRKGARFLKGDDVPRFAIISKTEKRQIGYLNELTDITNIRQFGNDSQYWMEMEYDY